MQVAPGSTFDLANRLAGGDLAHRLRAWRARNPPVTFDEIARILTDEGIPTSREKARRWCRDLARADAAGENAA